MAKGKKVTQVPNAWEPFMDGDIWELTREEMAGMPGFKAMQTVDGEWRGKRMIQWYVGDRYYVRFVESNDPRTPEELAGWVIPPIP